ncbi:MAG: hypothetical protein LCH54_17395 [Bacteroidetes bacterium]|nr:hypothetical protein [Bacteroidota bacterium]
MSKLHKISHQFITHVPSPLKYGVVYISIEFGTVIHKCCCGCGDKVVTPLTPVDWALTYDGQSISLQPSIGRWDAPCRSHYWIQKNQVIWTTELSKFKTEILKRYETDNRNKYFELENEQSNVGNVDTPSQISLGWGWLKLIFKKVERKS